VTASLASRYLRQAVKPTIPFCFVLLQTAKHLQPLLALADWNPNIGLSEVNGNHARSVDEANDANILPVNENDIVARYLHRLPPQNA